jgi:hypothetical protein
MAGEETALAQGSGVPNGTPEPHNYQEKANILPLRSEIPAPPKVTGRDGKSYSAAKPKARKKNTPAKRPTAQKKDAEKWIGKLVRALESMDLLLKHQANLEAIKKDIREYKS